MTKNRLEAFSDGVIAIIITIMVLELKVPQGDTLQDLWPLWPKFLSYLLSFVYLGIYWNNHHHLLQTLHRVSGAVMWANLHLLFWLSIIPFATGWMGESAFAPQPMALYGAGLLACALAWIILQRAIIKVEGPDSALARAVGSDRKGRVSEILYVCGIPLAFVHPVFSGACYVAVALIWLVPDRRIERQLARDPHHPEE
jgi:uncharacterized membrane protein